MLPMISTLLSGFIFGLGLLISGMANPVKVLGFLDITGAWDPSLAFVMTGAILIGVIAFSIAKKRTVSLLGEAIQLPTAHHIDHRLIAGSAVFGIGWGIAGICPGPGLVALSMGEMKALIFVLAMLVGMWVFELLEKNSLDT